MRRKRLGFEEKVQFDVQIKDNVLLSNSANSLIGYYSIKYQ
jgi:hypothetical protein